MTAHSATELWQLLPELYRTDDNGTSAAPGDLARFVGSFQLLLDQLRATLDQRLADCFPDQPANPEELACQSWLLPYFAELFDAKLLSPQVAGQRREVAEVIAWRQRKGTHRIADRIAEAITGRDAQGNGGRHVEHQEGWQRVLTTLRVDPPIFSDPQRPTVGTVDLRLSSRAAQVDAGNPSAHQSTYDAPPVVFWTHRDPNGSPLYPDSYEDVSLRTVDVRSPGRRVGHAHPGRFLVYVAPPDGYFSPGGMGGAPPDVVLDDGKPHTLHGAVIGTLTVRSTPVTVSSCTVTSLAISGDQPVTADSCAIETVTSSATATVEISRSVLGAITDGGIMQLEYCTVLGDASLDQLMASDCIFAGKVVLGSSGAIRYSRLGSVWRQQAVATYKITATTPIFVAGYGARGGAVLDPATSKEIRSGAEDGGEMGAYHDQAYAREDAAIAEKLASHLPYGVTPVLIPDPRLHITPPPVVAQ